MVYDHASEVVIDKLYFSNYFIYNVFFCCSIHLKVVVHTETWYNYIRIVQDYTSYHYKTYFNAIPNYTLQLLHRNGIYILYICTIYIYIPIDAFCCMS